MIIWFLVELPFLGWRLGPLKNKIKFQVLKGQSQSYMVEGEGHAPFPLK